MRRLDVANWRRRFVTPRPYNLHYQDGRDWHERADAAVDLWLRTCDDQVTREGRTLRIADLGAGNERLRDVLALRLPYRFDYHAFDLLPQRSSTRLLDVRTASPQGHFDAVFCLGLLEYIPPSSDFVARLRTVCDIAIVSYVCVGPSAAIRPEARAEIGWLRSQDEASFEREFVESGFSFRGRVLANVAQTTIWVWGT